MEGLNYCNEQSEHHPTTHQQPESYNDASRIDPLDYSGKAAGARALDLYISIEYLYNSSRGEGRLKECEGRADEMRMLNKLQLVLHDV